MPNNYTMKSIEKGEKIKALFFNEIDSTVRKPEEVFVNIGESPELTKVKKDNSVSYSYNSLGFRSDEFTKDHNGDHVLFAGCSETEGVGGNLESCWSYITYSELSKENKLSGFFNLARYGWGYDIIIQNIMCYISEYGKPKTIFILFPNLGRFYTWDGNEEGFENFVHRGHIPNSVTNYSEKSSWKRKINAQEQRSQFIIFTMIVKLFEEYCKSNSINLYWSTWDSEDSLNYSNANVFKYFLPIADIYQFIQENNDYFLKEIRTRSDWQSKRDGHSGYVFHKHWSKHFLQRLDSKKD
jgi:hypothetical protein